ncbi:MAG: hypothetical protein Q7K98_00255 [Candidatus Omnitrophota bacterium]|nr:hypothetical protein [Candidatus Omnitrophota bacterium]
MWKINKKGQSTAEYAIVIGLVVAAIVAMQIYVKRGLQGKVKDAVDYKDAGDTVTGTTTQYEPYYSSSTMTSTRAASEKAEVTTGGGVTRTISGEDISTRTGSQTIGAAQSSK